MTDSGARPDPAFGPQTTADPRTTDGPAAAGTGDRVLLVVFWVWAGLLLTAMLAQLFGWEGLLDALDVKRWFSR